MGSANKVAFSDLELPYQRLQAFGEIRKLRGTALDLLAALRDIIHRRTDSRVLLAGRRGL